MKIKHKIPKVVIFCSLLILLLPLMTSAAQSDDQEPDFLITLALMAVADDRMDGVMDTADLSNLRALVDEYYDTLPYSQLNNEQEYRIRAGRDAIINALDAKIAFESNRSDKKTNVILLQKMVDGFQTFKREENPFEQASEYILMDVIASIGEYQADPVYLDLLRVSLQKDYEKTLNNHLDGSVADSFEGGDQFVAQNSDTVYDFSAGLTKEAYLAKLSQTKPLVFINNGARDVTVSIEYFAPPKGLAISAPGLNLTVAKENQVTATGFPQGNYTFCAHWQTDLDTNNDGVKDYDRMVTHIWLSSASPDDPNMAEEVYVNSVGTATPTGRCDGFVGEAPETEELMTEIFMTEDDPQISEVPPQEATDTGQDTDFSDQEEETQDTQDGDLPDVDQPSQQPQEETPTYAPPEENTPTESSPQETGFTLTPAELANQGVHNYQITCERSWGFTDTNSVTANWEFTPTGLTQLTSGNTYVKVAENIYQNDFPTTITFTTSGYQLLSYVYETDSDGATTTYTTQCTAIFE